jgi:uncharacterized RDD family membrane protein YckC
VELRFDVAGLGSRLAAACIDYTIIAIGYIALFLGSGAFAAIVGRYLPPPREFGQFMNNAWLAFLIVFSFLGWWGYFLLFELLWAGQSPGKRWLGLRVARRDGQPLNFTTSLVRNTLRWVDQVLLVGVFAMLIDSSSRRLGDMAAGTLVVREPRALRRQAFTPVELPEVPETRVQELPNAGRISATEYAIIRDFFARVRELDLREADQLALRMTQTLARSLEVDVATIGDPRLFLATVARAYEARHREGEQASSA